MTEHSKGTQDGAKLRPQNKIRNLEHQAMRGNKTFWKTGEDHVCESKFYMLFQPQKRAWKNRTIQWHHLVHLALSCGVVWSPQRWNSFNAFSIVNQVSAGVPTPPDSGKTPQLRTPKLPQNCGKNRHFTSRAFLRNALESLNRNASPNVNKAFIRF